MINRDSKKYFESKIKLVVDLKGLNINRNKL
jgi:hypothetical protein